VTGRRCEEEVSRRESDEVDGENRELTTHRRRNISYYWHESVKPLQYYCSCLPVSILLPMKKLLFWKKMLCSGNLILCRLAKCCDASMFALAAKYHIEPHDAVRSSVARIKDSFRFYFSELV